MKYYNLLLPIFLILLFGKVSAQSNNACGNSPQSGSYKWDFGIVRTTVKFELLGTLVIIPIEINKVKTKFILDTGMPAMGGMFTNSKKAASLNLNYTGEARIGGAGGGFSNAKVANNVSFRIGNIEFTNQTFIVMPESKNLSYFENDGIIGNEIFTRFITDINYDDQTITLINPANFQPPKDAEAIEIPFESNYPFVKCSAVFENGQTVPLNMVLDLGASHSASFILGSQKNITLPKKNIQVSVGRGINTEIFGNMGRIKSFKIGSYSFDNPLVTFNEKKLMPFEEEGNLGSGILNRFNIIFDYPNKRMFIKPNKSYKNSFEFNMAGIQYSKSLDGKLVIDKILPNSPGSESGLVALDEIIKIGNVDISNLDKNGLRKIFEKNNETVVLTIKRQEEIKTISIKLRRII